MDFFGRTFRGLSGIDCFGRTVWDLRRTVWPGAGTDSLVVQGVPAEVFNIGRSAMPRAELIALSTVIRLIEMALAS